MQLVCGYYEYLLHLNKLEINFCTIKVYFSERKNSKEFEMKRLLIPIIVFSIPMFVLSQQVTSLDAAPADTNYWSYYNPVNEGAESGPTGHFASCTDCDTSKADVKVS